MPFFWFPGLGMIIRIPNAPDFITGDMSDINTAYVRVIHRSCSGNSSVFTLRSTECRSFPKENLRGCPDEKRDYGVNDPVSIMKPDRKEIKEIINDKLKEEIENEEGYGDPDCTGDSGSLLRCPGGYLLLVRVRFLVLCKRAR